MTEQEFLNAFSLHIFKTHGTATKAAKHWNVSRPFVYMVKTGQRAPSKKMLADMGMELTVEKRYKVID